MDIHNHSMFSPDSDTPAELMIESAIRCGMQYFGISEHVDFHYTPSPLEEIYDVEDTDVAAYFRYVLPLKEKYAGKIKFLTALEFGYNEDADMSGFPMLEREYPLDYVINSIHTAARMSVYWRENLKNIDQREIYTAYLQAVLNSLDAPYGYEIVGHIGYICRNTPYADPKLRLDEYGDYIDAILKRIIKLDKTLELNTSVRHAGEVFLPGQEILSRYRELGGEHVSFASDSHTPDTVGKGYAATREILLAEGFRYLDVFEHRARKKILL